MPDCNTDKHECVADENGVKWRPIILQYRSNGGIPEDQYKFLRFFWWVNGDVHSEPVECEMCVHPFGAISSKSCVIFALHQAALKILTKLRLPVGQVTLLPPLLLKQQHHTTVMKDSLMSLTVTVIEEIFVLNLKAEFHFNIVTAVPHFIHQMAEVPH